MQKLTSEQAQWLLQKMQAKQKDVFWNALIGPNEFNFMHQLVSECMEKEFPELRIADIDGDVIKIFYEEHGGALITIRMQGSKVFLTSKQFLLFTEGCNKIAEWLKEKE